MSSKGIGFFSARVLAILFLSFSLSGLKTGYSQELDFSFQAANRLEYRLALPQKVASFRDWLDVDYYLGDFLTGFRFEQTQISTSADANRAFSQRFFEYGHDGLRLRVGNFYKRLGRGLLFHAFELQKISLNRVEQNFVVDRNVDGLLLDWQDSKFSATLLTGRPKWLFAKSGVQAADFSLQPVQSLSLGMTFLRVDNPDNPVEAQRKTEFFSPRLELFLNRGGIYAEYAHRQGSGKGSEKEARAIYLGSNFSFGRLGLSVEFKDYRHFFTGLNNPPTLVKEHSFTLLNRHSHQVNLNDEVGWQSEIVFSTGQNSTVVLNYSRAENHAREFSSLFEEKYLEYWQAFDSGIALRGAVDASRDRLIGDDRRWTGVVESDFPLGTGRSVTAFFQAQRIHNLFAGKDFENLLLGFGGNQAGVFSLYFQWEHTTNRLETRRDWFSLNLNVKMGATHDIFLTVGQQRAGLACASGQCRFVPEFRGVELRLNSRF